MEHFRSINMRPLSPGGGAPVIQALTKNAGLFIFSYSPRYRSLISWSDNAAQVLGVSDKYIVREGNLFLRYVHSDDRFTVLSTLEHALNSRSPYVVTYRWIRQDNGQVRWLHARAKLSDNGEASLLEGSIIDISEIGEHAPYGLRDTTSMTMLIDAMPELVLVLDRDLRIVNTNRNPPWGELRFGDKNFSIKDCDRGKSFLGCFSADSVRSDFVKIFAELCSGHNSRITMRLEQGGQTYDVQFTALKFRSNVEGVLIQVFNVTHFADSEKQLFVLEELQESQILTSTVIGRVADELNNIVVSAGAIKHFPDRNEVVNYESRNIYEAAFKSMALIRELPGAKGYAGALQSVDPNLAAMGALVRARELSPVRCSIHPCLGRVPNVAVSSEWLTEVCLLLLRLGSSEATKGSHIEFITDACTFPAQDDVVIYGTPCVRISVVVNTAMTASLKEDGCEAEGHEIFRHLKNACQKNEGTLTRSSEALGRVRFSIYLVSDINSASGIIERPSPFCTRPPQVLLVDDEAGALSSFISLFAALGYQCSVVTHLKKAHHLVHAYTDSLRLVVAAIPPIQEALQTMLRRIRGIKPELKVIGVIDKGGAYTDELLTWGLARVLRLPLDEEAVKSAIQEILQMREAA